MRRKKRAASIQRLAPISFEGVGEIVQRHVEQKPQKPVGHAIDEQLVSRIVDHPAAADEARSEHRIVSLAEHLPVAHHIAAVVGFVGHHDDHRVALAMIDPADNRAAETMLAGILYGADGGNARRQPLHHRPGGIRAAVIHRHDFVLHAVQP